MRRVGILGGMGPEATVLLMQKVIEACPATDDAGHVPLLVDQNPAVPSRIKALIEGTGPSPAPVLIAMAEGLAAAGVEALAMPCNTAHAYLDQVRGRVALPILDMIGLSAEALSAVLPAGGRVGMLASPAVRHARVFDAALAAHGLVPVWPADEAALLGLIRAVKAGQKGAGPEAELARIAGDLARHGGCAAVLVACTELSLLTSGLGAGLPAGLPWADSLDLLATAIVEFARG